MTQTVYLKLSQITQVHEKNVPLASLGEVYCSEKSVESRCRAMIVKRIRGGGKQRESRLVGNVMEIIQQIEREIPESKKKNRTLKSIILEKPTLSSLLKTNPVPDLSGSGARRCSSA